MKRRAFTLFSYLVAFVVLVIMLEPAAEAKLDEVFFIYRYTGSVKATAEAAVGVTPVPEPSRMILLLIGSLPLLFSRRR